MLDLSVSRKNKINLTDYDYEMDIKNRSFMSQFVSQDIELLEEILYGSIRIPLAKLAKNLDVTASELNVLLKKIEPTGLFTIEKDAIVIDKDMRKYYDYQVMKFDEDFKPNMNYIQGILRKVPIHVLPVWYAVPRSSNNIFESMVERYFKTPHIYERYLLELNLTEPVMAGIVSELFASKDLQLETREVIETYGLNRELFEEYMLHLEFSFVCCLKYIKQGDQYVEVIVPFHEWAEFLKFKQSHAPKPIDSKQTIDRKTTKPFQFIKDMAYLLEEIVHKPLPLKPSASENDFLFEEDILSQLVVGCGMGPLKKDKLMQWQHYFSRLASRLTRLELTVRNDEKLSPHHQAAHWLNMELEDKALYLYRHPQNRTLQMGFDPNLDTEKNVREAEKTLERIEVEGWFMIDKFLEGAICSIGQSGAVTLHKEGPNWSYRIPKYNPEEMQFMSYVIMQRLFEVGMVEVGVCNQQDCFKLLPFGRDTLC